MLNKFKYFFYISFFAVCFLALPTCSKADFVYSGQNNYNQNPIKLKSLSEFKKEIDFNTRKKMKKLADLRGVVSNSDLKKLEKSEISNPIEGYNSVCEESLEPIAEKQAPKPKQKPVIAKKEEIKEVEKPIEIAKEVKPMDPFKQALIEEITLSESAKGFTAEEIEQVTNEIIAEQEKRQTIKNHSELGITLASLVGLNKEEIDHLLFSPVSKIQTKAADIWTYENTICQAKLYFHQEECMFGDIKSYAEGFDDTDLCISSFFK